MKAAPQKVLAQPHVELLSAIDLKTGQPRWQRCVDWTVCGGGRGTLIYQDGLLLMLSDVGGCKAFSGYGLEDQLGRSVAVRDAQTGNLVWLKALNHRSRIVVVGETIFAEPWMYDLRSGAQKMVKHPTTGADVPQMFMRPEKHCGSFNASAHTLFFRNGGFGYYDVPRNEGVTRFESNRPNCWLSFISAEGLALWPTSDFRHGGAEEAASETPPSDRWHRPLQGILDVRRSADRPTRRSSIRYQATRPAGEGRSGHCQGSRWNG